MTFFKLFFITFIIAAFLTACESLNQPETVYTDQQPIAEAEAANPWARENLDLQSVGALLEKADNAEEFEYLLNSDDGVNNLDLNGDGYADYISVREFDDRDDNQRGFSLFSMFGPDLIQEIAQVIFYRDRPNYPGSRVLLIGNDQIYGDNYYYETDWQDRSVPIATWVFEDRGDFYRSPYYYDNYPNYYQVYEVVDTPVYRTRIQEYYYAPVFVRTTQPAITQIKIKSPYNGKSWDKIYSKLAKPTRDQIEFKKNNPNRPQFVPVKKGNPNPNRVEDRPKGNPNKWDKPNRIEREKINPPKQMKLENPNVKPQKQNGNPNPTQKQNGNPNPKGNNGGGKGGGNKGGKGGGKKG